MNSPALITVPDNASALDVLALRYRAAFDKINGGREQWIEGTLELGAVISEAVGMFPATQEYSRWLGRHQLEHLSPNDRRAIVAIYEMERGHPGTGQKLLGDNIGLALRTIWEKKAPKINNVPLSKRDKGTRRAIGHASGHEQRRRAQRIPDVMRDDPPPPLPAPSPSPPPQYTRLTDKGLTREQVDPDFKGTAIQFAAKYGPVHLYTKDQIEHSKRQDVLNEWLGAASALNTAAIELLATHPDPSTLQEWLAKPAKAGKFRAWLDRIQQACDYLQAAIGAPKCPSS